MALAGVATLGLIADLLSEPAQIGYLNGRSRSGRSGGRGVPIAPQHPGASKSTEQPDTIREAVGRQARIAAGAERVPEGRTPMVHTSSRTASGRTKPIHVTSPRGEHP